MAASGSPNDAPGIPEDVSVRQPVSAAYQGTAPSNGHQDRGQSSMETVARDSTSRRPSSAEEHLERVATDLQQAGAIRRASSSLTAKERESYDPVPGFTVRGLAHTEDEGKFLPTEDTNLKSGVAKVTARLRKKFSNYTPMDWFAAAVPSVRWMRIYDWRKFLMADVIAGLTVGVMVVPQAMSYAGIAGLPSNYGLYGAFFPVLIYAFFGSSRQLAVGPVAITSLLVHEGLIGVDHHFEDIDDPNAAMECDAEKYAGTPDGCHPYHELQVEYNNMAIMVSFLVAILYFAVGGLQLGFLSNFLSHSVISGFTSGASVIIGLSQIKYIVGFDVKRSSLIYEVLEHLFTGMEDFEYQEFLMGASWLAILIAMKHFGKKVSKLKWMRPLGPLTVSVLSIILVAAGGLDKSPHNIKIIKFIPSGLPPASVNKWSFGDAGDLLQIAFVVMIVGLMESISIAKALAMRNKYELDPNQELLGLGAANLAGAIFSAYPTTGSFSRSAVANDTGAKTGLAGLVTAACVGFVLLVLTPMFEKMPYNALSAIVISGVLGLFEYSEAIHLWKLSKLDWAVWMTSFLGTLFLGVEIGLAIAIGLAMLFVIYESAFPHTAVLGRLPATTVYRNIKQYKAARQVDGLLVMRVDAPMYFANVQWIKDRLKKYEARAEAMAQQAEIALKFVIMDLSPVSSMDASACHVLQDLIKDYKSRDIHFVMSNPSKRVMDVLHRAGIPEMIGSEFVFVRVHDAVQYCQALLLEEAKCRTSEAKEEGAAGKPTSEPIGNGTGERQPSSDGGAVAVQRELHEPISSAQL